MGNGMLYFNFYVRLFWDVLNELLWLDSYINMESVIVLGYQTLLEFKQSLLFGYPT